VSSQSNIPFSDELFDTPYDFGVHIASLNRLRTPEVITPLAQKYGIPDEEIGSVAEQAYFVALGLPLLRHSGRDTHLDAAELVFASYMIDDICDSPYLSLGQRRNLMNLIRFAYIENELDLEIKVRNILAVLENARTELNILGPDVRDLTFETLVPVSSPNRRLFLLSLMKLSLAGLMQTSAPHACNPEGLQNETAYYFAMIVNNVSNGRFYDLENIPHEAALVATASGLLEWFGAVLPLASKRGLIFESWNGVLGVMVHLSNNKEEVQIFRSRISLEELAAFVKQSW